jgi:hypothetical protein
MSLPQMTQIFADGSGVGRPSPRAPFGGLLPLAALGSARAGYLWPLAAGTGQGLAPAYS